MLLSHRHLVYCGLSFVSLLVLCYLPCDILINIIAEPFRYVPPPSASCCLLWSEHCFTVGIMLPAPTSPAVLAASVKHSGSSVAAGCDTERYMSTPSQSGWDALPLRPAGRRLCCRS